MQGGKKKNQSSPLLLWGIYPILEIVKTHPRQLKQIFISPQKPNPRLQEIIDLADEKEISVEFSKEAFANAVKKIDTATVAHQGVVAVSDPFPTVGLSELIEIIQGQSTHNTSPTILVLDSIQDPQNVGAIMRSALAAGVAGVIIAKDRSAHLGGAVAKASAGAISRLKICQVVNLTAVLQALKEIGLWIYGTLPDADVSLYDTDLTGPLCLVMGGEQKGLRPLVRKQCDFFLSIPMMGGLGSLNASTATAIILFEIVRQKQIVR